MQTADGCSVELYRQLPYHGELEPIRVSFEPGTKVLELGCGTGRHTRKMLEWGALVTAVDNSAEMLAAVPSDACRVLGDIESLELDGQFSLVLLASNLINHPIAGVRQAFLRAARRHLAAGGKVLVERHDPEWLSTAHLGKQGSVGPVSLFVESAERENQRVRIALRYEVGSQAWRQSFEAVVLQELEVEAMLAEAGFASHTWLGCRRRWVQSLAV
jgi:SAM-dependent methyltransferase